MRTLFATLLLSSSAYAQDKPADPEVDPKAVDAAIEKGLQWLLKKHDQNTIPEVQHTELVLLTLVHAGCKPEHPLLRDNFNRLLARPLWETYNVGLRGLLLEKVNRAHYQPQLAEIAMFFVESQCQNGQWTYTGRSRRPTPAAYSPVATGGKKKDLPGSTRTDDEGPPPRKEVKLKLPDRESGVKNGDNSNTQYALLGLFAASRAAVIVPKETWQQVEKWFESRQHGDGGWGYDGDMAAANQDPSYGSMSTAALTGLILSKFYLGKDWKKEASATKGLDWMGLRFSVGMNPGGRGLWHYYYLYGLERVGMISGLKEFGRHPWYKEGAEYLLRAQKADGSWKAPAMAGATSDEVLDTCFAILFLRKATPELKTHKDIVKDIATGDARKKDDEKKGNP